MKAVAAVADKVKYKFRSEVREPLWQGVSLDIRLQTDVFWTPIWEQVGHQMNNNISQEISANRWTPST